MSKHHLPFGFEPQLGFGHFKTNINHNYDYLLDLDMGSPSLTNANQCVTSKVLCQKVDYSEPLFMPFAFQSK
jgi:hypothetical protein